MSWLFGGRKQKKPAVDPEKSLQEMNETVNLLEKKQDLLQKQIHEELQAAKVHKANDNKTGALNCLKKKKQLEAKHANIAAQISNIHVVIGEVEAALIQQMTLQAMQGGAKALKQIQQETGSLEDIEKRMDDFRELIEQSKNVSDVLSQTIGEEYDEDELEDELAALNSEESVTMDDDLEEEFAVLSGASSAKLAKAKVPTGPIKKDKDDLDDLEAELSAL